MQYLFTKIIATILAPFLFIGAVLNPVSIIEQPTQSVNLGAALPGATAVFETSLASPITSTATSMTLSANAVRGGGSISGYNCLTVDEGKAEAETLCGTVSGTSVTGISRGISQSTGTTTVAILKFAHRRGANVKITDFPIIQILKAQNNGEDTFENPIRYASTVSTSTLALNTNNIASVGYVTSAALNAGNVLTATETSGGFVELATGTEAANGTSSGTVGRLALPASIASSTYNSTGANQVVVTNGSNKIDNNFIATSTLFANTNLPSTVTLATSTSFTTGIPLMNIGKNSQVFSSTGTTTFSVPSGVTKLSVTVQAGGGGGGADPGNTSNPSGGGGGAGGFSMENVDVTGTSTIQLYVGAAGEWSTFGTNGSYLYATAGSNGANGSSGGAGGAGGSGFASGGTGAQGIVIVRW